MWWPLLLQVAATLAAALVAFDALNFEGRGLIDEPVLNSIVVLMPMAFLLRRPALTELVGKRLAASKAVEPCGVAKSPA
jgi:hypothetical protein